MTDSVSPEYVCGTTERSDNCRTVTRKMSELRVTSANFNIEVVEIYTARRAFIKRDPESSTPVRTRFQIELMTLDTFTQQCNLRRLPAAASKLIAAS